jgi:hypothetical protein
MDTLAQAFTPMDLRTTGTPFMVTWVMVAPGMREMALSSELWRVRLSATIAATSAIVPGAVLLTAQLRDTFWAQLPMRTQIVAREHRQTK